MKINFLLFILSLFSLKIFAQEPNKIALIVAISKYPPNSGWAELSSDNDVKLIKDALMRQGFKSENIAILKDKQATLAGMSAAFDKELIQKAKAGDVAVFHFSGHGQQIEDDNGDEADGLDEALVPYDAPAEWKPGRPDNHFRDDLLEQKLIALRLKLGAKGSMLVIADACHSGTITRGLGIKRGTSEIYASPAFKAKQTNKVVMQETSYGIVDNEKNMSPMACYFACSPAESNSEAVLPDKTGAGSLSLAFSMALANADKNASYRGLFDNIKVVMSSLVASQTPLAEGELDYTIFGGQALGKPLYYKIDIDPKTNLLSIPTGKIFGIFNNSTIKLYKPDTRDTVGVKPMAEGIVSDAGEYASTIKLDRTLSKADMQSAWVYLAEINYGDLGVKVKMNISDASLKNNVATILKDIKQASLADNADLFLQNGMNAFSADSLYLVNSAEMIIWQTPKNIDKQNLADTLSMKIGDYARSKYLRNLALSNESYKVTFEFVPVKCIADCDTRNSKFQDDNSGIKTKMDASGNITFKEGDRFRLNIINHNTENKKLYYTVLDIQPDNQVNVLIPRKKDQPEDYTISGGDTVELRQQIFKIGPPYGIDVLKIIASDVPLDMRKIFTSRGAGTRGAPLGPFEKIIQGTYNAEGPHTRGPAEEAIQPDAVNIITIPFHIIKNGAK